jgi:DNA repair protein RadD
MLVLRDYQQAAKTKVYDAWKEGHKFVLLRMPTGAGKTKTFCSITIDMALLAAEKYPTAILVHRKELVQQISLTLAEEEIPHNIIAPRPVIMGIIGAQRRVLRRQFYDYNAPITVVSVDTLNARILKHQGWAKSIRLWITDEAAHLLKNNKWGRAVGYFPNAIGLGVTATPQRLDKKGLGSHVDGVFDAMVEGPDTRWLIDNGYLSKYKIAIPDSDFQRYLGKASEGSDFSKDAMIQASRQSHIIGDVVTNYQKFANGLQAILFTTDIETGRQIEQNYKVAGINAKLLTSESSDKERLDGLLDFQQKKIKVLINVDLFDEGLDVPGIECVIMARPTMSLSKYLQMCGRGLRPAPNKPYMILIDHVGNVMTHGLPCERRRWSLDRTIRRRDKTNLIRICSNITCNAPYDRVLTVCPWCGTEAIMRGGGGGGGKIFPKQVDGDLQLLDPETLRELEANTHLEEPASVARRVGTAVNMAAGRAAAQKQLERIETQKELVHVIAKWAGFYRHWGYTDRQIHKKFYLEYDRTITEALSEPRAEMQDMIDRLESDIKPYSYKGRD